jgi:hypothetical protein
VDQYRCHKATSGGHEIRGDGFDYYSSVDKMAAEDPGHQWPTEDDLPPGEGP